MPRVDTRFPVLRARHERDNLEALGTLFAAMRDDVLARVESSASVLLPKRWDDRLQEVIFDRNRVTAREIGSRVAKALSGKRDARAWSADVMDPWLTENARIAAERINEATRGKLDDTDEPAAALDILLSSSAAMYARGMVTSSANFAAADAAKSSGAGAKMWQTNSGNSRSSHAAMGGEVVPLRSTFSNGMRWPGDSAGGAGEVANCQCSLTLL